MLDTGILVSAFLTQQGLADELLTRSARQERLCLSNAILAETRGVLIEKERIRSLYAYEDADVDDFLDRVRDVATFVTPRDGVRVIERDPKDDVILATALAAGAAYLVARDAHLLDLGGHEGVVIVAPEEFMHILRDRT